MLGENVTQKSRTYSQILTVIENQTNEYSLNIYCFPDDPCQELGHSCHIVQTQ